MLPNSGPGQGLLRPGYPKDICLKLDALQREREIVMAIFQRATCRPQQRSRLSVVYSMRALRCRPGLLIGILLFLWDPDS